MATKLLSDATAAQIIDAHVDDSRDTDYRVEATGESIIEALRLAGYVIQRGD
jgi:hypothetical protein